MNTKITGNKGEDIARLHLIKNGYKIEQTNWHWHHKEIDIIASNNTTIIFIEVKTRQQNSITEIKDILTNKQQSFLIEAADAYIEKYNINKVARFDVILILINNKTHKIKHIEDAISPQW